MRFIQDLFKFMGLEGRLHLAWISSAEAQKFTQVVTEFTEKIRKLGPNPLSGKNIHPFGDTGNSRAGKLESIQGGQDASAG